MISRRSFIKITSLAAAALGSGYGIGKLSGHGELESFSIHGFIPGDSNVIEHIVKIFNKKAPGVPAPQIYAEREFAYAISRAYKSSVDNIKMLNNGKVVFRMVKLNEETAGDILFSDSKTVVYNPLLDFNGEISSLRRSINNTKAGYLFSAEYSQDYLLSSLLKSKETVAVIENARGVADKIKLTGNYKNVEVKGSIGRTLIKIENG